MLKEKWVVLTKSKVLEMSPVNMDGSEFMYGHNVIFAENADDAVDQLRSALLDKVKLELVEIMECKPYLDSDWNDESERSELVNEAYKEASQTGELAFGGFLSSESLNTD